MLLKLFENFDKTVLRQFQIFWTTIHPCNDKWPKKTSKHDICVLCITALNIGNIAIIQVSGGSVEEDQQVQTTP